jgi:proteasome lid subunit RPN8/RPN11
VSGAGFEFHIEVTRGGALVGSGPASAAACLEDALFRSVIAGRVPNGGTLPPHALVPEWSGDPPSVTGLALSFGGAPPERYGVGVFAAQAAALVHATAAAAAREERPRDEPARDEQAARELEWRVVAREAPPRAARFAARASRAPWPLEAARLPGVARDELDVEIAAECLAGLRDESLRAGALERAWLLLGRVLHDTERAAAAVLVREALAVRPGAGGASRIHFAFGPEAWAAARRAARGVGGLVPVGWCHSHPPCANCPANPACEAETLFFSADDRAVHSAAFASPYMLGLVVGKLRRFPATRPGFRLFGWSRGELRARDFRLRGTSEGAGGRPASEEGRWPAATRC